LAGSGFLVAAAGAVFPYAVSTLSSGVTGVIGFISSG